MKRAIAVAVMLIWAGVAHAQTIGNGSIDGLQYETMTSPDGCSAASPCQIITYFHYLGGEGPTPSDLQKYFNTAAFWAANPHTIILAPMVNGSSDTNNWGGVQEGMSPNMKAAIDLVKQIEATVPTNPNTVVATGGSMGGIATEAAMVEAGPKGTVDPGVFAAGLSYDGALYNSDYAAAATALCGVPFTMVHGAQDTTVPHSFDDNLASTLSSCVGFKYVSVPGIGHGTWNYGPAGGYEDGKLIDATLASAANASPTTASAPAAVTSSVQPLSTGTGQTSTVQAVASTTSTTATPPPASPTVTPAAAQDAMPAATGDVELAQQEIALVQALRQEPTPNETLIGQLLDDAMNQLDQAQTGTAATSQTCSSDGTTITPGQGSLTDSKGDVWSINDNTKILVNGIPVVGGGDTSEMTLQGCAVMGHSNGQNGSSTSWFAMNAADPTATDGWTVSDAPGSVSTAMVPITPAPQTATAPVAQTAVPPVTKPLDVATPSTTANSCPVDSSGGTGRFQVAGGQLIGPNGKNFIARGINVSDRDMSAAADILKMFPGINLVRLAIYTYQDPSAYSAFIATMTGHGTVVLIEHHVETNGATGGGGQGGIASGAWLADENAFYAAVAKAFAGNPYVFFGTTNEPPGQSGLSAWQLSTYKAVRGAGNNNPVLLEISGWPGDWTNALDPSVYAQMTNVVWDPHFYGWVSRYSTDQATIDAALADIISSIQTITSADGVIPAMVAEFGPSTTGMSPDPNGDGTVDAVITRGANDQTGSAIWHWGQQDCCNNLGDASGLTTLGQKVQLFIGTDVQQPTQCQLTAAAQQGIANVTAAMQPVAQ